VIEGNPAKSDKGFCLFIKMTTLPFIPYNKSNNDYSRENRKKPTLAELIVREEILKHRPLGYKFTRQKPL